jgi:hypothetical protein
MNGSVTDVTVLFRDAAEARPLAARLVAVAHRHSRGWTLNLGAAGQFECLTFDAVASAVAKATGVHKLLIIWPNQVVQD